MTQKKPHSPICKPSHTYTYNRNVCCWMLLHRAELLKKGRAFFLSGNIESPSLSTTQLIHLSVTLTDKSQHFPQIILHQQTWFVFEQQTAHSILWLKEFKGHRPGVSGQPEKDGRGHSHSESIFEQKQISPLNCCYYTDSDSTNVLTRSKSSIILVISEHTCIPMVKLTILNLQHLDNKTCLGLRKGRKFSKQ